MDEYSTTHLSTVEILKLLVKSLPKQRTWGKEPTWGTLCIRPPESRPGLLSSLHWVIGKLNLCWVYVHQTVVRLRNQSTSASTVLGLKAYATSPNNSTIFVKTRQCQYLIEGAMPHMGTFPMHIE